MTRSPRPSNHGRDRFINSRVTEARRACNYFAPIEVASATRPIHCRGSARVRNSCNFCPDNSFTSGGIIRRRANVTRIAGHGNFFFFIPLFFRRLADVRVSVACLYAFADVCARACELRVAAYHRVEVTREGETRGWVQRKCSLASCAQHRMHEAHKIPSRVGISVFFSLYRAPFSVPTRYNQHRGKLTEWQWRALIFIRAIFDATSRCDLHRGPPWSSP